MPDLMLFAFPAPIVTTSVCHQKVGNGQKGDIVRDRSIPTSSRDVHYHTSLHEQAPPQALESEHRKNDRSRLAESRRWEISSDRNCEGGRRCQRQR